MTSNVAIRPLDVCLVIGLPPWNGAIGVFVAVMLGLYIWSHITARHAIGKKVQPFIDDLFSVGPKTEQNPRDEDHR